MSSVFQFRSVTLIALTQICGSNHRASDFSFFQQTHNVQISPYILLVLYKITFENKMDQILSHHYLVTLVSQATTACGKSGTSSGKSTTDTASNFTLSAGLLKRVRSYSISCAEFCTELN